jgi:hypothetical protein
MPGEIVLRKSKYDSNWYMIEWKNHANREWWERTGPNSSRFRRSARICDAEVEGTLEEMTSIARAILDNNYCSFKRCGVNAVNDLVTFYSPRNSQTAGIISKKHATSFAKEVLTYSSDKFYRIALMKEPSGQEYFALAQNSDDAWHLEANSSAFVKWFSDWRGVRV